ncbi:MAG: methyltransferase domain-containing protein [Clostridia bacterium]|nr:methyltransferase domain-containing protein [Clostridia bacterium]
MSEWNSDLYLKFKQQRTQPALDLAKRIEKYNPLSVADLGCGPGNSTSVLKSVFPNARLIGIDNSSNMIEKASQTYPDIEFRLDDIQNLNEKHDLIFSNACLQWIPNHHILLPHLMEQLNDNGVLAVQIPINWNEPLFKIIKNTAEQSDFDFSQAYFENNDALSPNEYYEILSMCASSFDIWETVYYHEMLSHEELINWVRSTRLRPYLDCLNEREQEIFEKELLKKVKDQYPVMKNGNVILKFRRLFFVAIK